MSSSHSHSILIAQTADDIQRCFALIQCLRPALQAQDFVPQVQRQIASGYVLAYQLLDGEVVGVIGYGLHESLARGKFLYIDDLVTAGSVRGQGYGRSLLQHALAVARAKACKQVHLDSGVTRSRAHRFYLNAGFELNPHHFRCVL